MSESETPLTQRAEAGQPNLDLISRWHLCLAWFNHIKRYNTGSWEPQSLKEALIKELSEYQNIKPPIANRANFFYNQETMSDTDQNTLAAITKDEIESYLALKNPNKFTLKYSFFSRLSKQSPKPTQDERQREWQAQAAELQIEIDKISSEIQNNQIIEIERVFYKLGGMSDEMIKKILNNEEYLQFSFLITTTYRLRKEYDQLFHPTQPGLTDEERVKWYETQLDKYKQLQTLYHQLTLQMSAATYIFKKLRKRKKRLLEDSTS